MKRNVRSRSGPVSTLPRTRRSLPAQGAGIARAAAPPLAFAREGALDAAADLSQAGLDETAHRIAGIGGTVICNVAESEQVAAAFAQTVARFGRLDVAFNNAGIKQPVAKLADLSEDAFDRVSAVDLKSVFLCMEHEVPLMLESGGGAIVNTSSGAGISAVRGQSAYCASKFGVRVIALSRTASLDYAADNIRVSATCPGIIETPMMDRFTGGMEEGRARVVAQEPVGRMRSRRRSYTCVPTRRGSSRGTPW